MRSVIDTSSKALQAIIVKAVGPTGARPADQLAAMFNLAIGRQRLVTTVKANRSPGMLNISRSCKRVVKRPYVSRNAPCRHRSTNTSHTFRRLRAQFGVNFWLLGYAKGVL